MLFPLLFCSFIRQAFAQNVLATALVVDRLSLNFLKVVQPPSVENISSIFLPQGVTEEEAKAKPFHVYDEGFLDIIGSNPTLNVIATSRVDPIFHEAVVWYPETEEMFFVQDAGAREAGTGLNKSNIIQKISLEAAQALVHGNNETAEVEVITVNADPPVINSNGATNFRGQFVFAGQGQGDEIAPALYLMNPREPYNTTVIVNNFYGRQFNSLNDVATNPRNGEIYFTDSLYGYLQDFRPPPGIPTQVYRLNPDTGALTTVADGFDKPNGITFSPNGSFAYVTDTGAANAFYGLNFSAASTIYRYKVEDDGTFSSRKTFAYVSPGIPDGVHCDTNGNVYSGAGDGVQVWNPSGTLLGKIYLGRSAANFRFAGKGRMIIAAQTELYYATLAAEGADPEDQF